MNFEFELAGIIYGHHGVVARTWSCDLSAQGLRPGFVTSRVHIYSEFNNMFSLLFFLTNVHIHYSFCSGVFILIGISFPIYYVP